MANDPNTSASVQEIAGLRSEIEHLRAEQEAQKRQIAGANGHSRTEGETGDGGHAPASGKEPEQPQRMHRFPKPLIVVAALVLALVAVLWWLHARKYESTDDAEVDGHISGVAARISGEVQAVYVEENQFVKAGQALVDIDPRDYQNAAEQARSRLSQAQAQMRAEEPNLPVTRVANRTNISNGASGVSSAEAGVAAAQRDYEAALAKVHEAEANNTKAQADVNRYRPLAEKDEVSRQQFDQVVATAKAAAATVTSAQASAAASLQQVEQRQAQLAQARERLQQAQQDSPHEIAIRQANVATRQAGAAVARAQADQAALNLSYCHILSPVDGIVAKRTAELGQHLAPGQEVALISRIEGLWITANFRETQLRRMRPGQPARIYVDALDEDYKGSVESMPAATGAVTSVLPPENASGNFVKVVQRLPVRIRLDPDQPGLDRLRPGMSVEPTVQVR